MSWSVVEIKLKCANSTEIYRTKKNLFGITSIVWMRMHRGSEKDGDEHFLVHFNSFLSSTCKNFSFPFQRAEYTQNAFLLSHMTQLIPRYVWFSWFPRRDQRMKENHFSYTNQINGFSHPFIKCTHFDGKYPTQKCNLEKVFQHEMTNFCSNCERSNEFKKIRWPFLILNENFSSNEGFDNNEKVYINYH